MTHQVYITTSWDDGHPLDLRIADMLADNGLRGTFYIPLTSEHPTMTPAQIRQLCSAFDVGSHTLYHTDLSSATDAVVHAELVDSKAWIEDISGRPCSSFCPPMGRFHRRHLPLIRNAGYSGIRTVECFSLDLPRSDSGLLIMPTTLQAHSHRPINYLKNALRRFALRNLWLYIAYGTACSWDQAAHSLMEYVLARGGVLHLWGHSWELQETAQWTRLKTVLQMLGRFAIDAIHLTNSELCSAALRHSAEPLCTIRASVPVTPLPIAATHPSSLHHPNLHA